MEHWSEGALSRDRFLGGRLLLHQPSKGYRAGNDPVFLAASVPAHKGQSVLDLGCGVGAASLCIGTRVAGVQLTGVERQPAYAELAEHNARANGIALEVFCVDLTQLPAALRQKQFDHVVANPPFFRAGQNLASFDAGRAAGRVEETPLESWFETAAKRLKARGKLHMIHHVERLPETLAAAQTRLGSLEVLPLASRSGRAPDRFILRAQKNGRAVFRLWPSLVLHDGHAHAEDGGAYSQTVEAILRDGAALYWPKG